MLDDLAVRAVPFAVLVYLSSLIGALLDHWSSVGDSAPRLRVLARWTPRLGLLVYAGFFSVLAAGVLDQEYETVDLVTALLWELEPTLIVLAVLALSWRWPVFGSLAAIGWSVWYAVTAWAGFDPEAFVAFAGLPFSLGALFLLDWRFRPHGRTRPTMPAVAPDRARRPRLSGRRAPRAARLRHA